MRLCRLLLILLSAICFLPSVQAADGAMSPLLSVVATDGKTYAPRFAAGLSLDNGLTFRTSAVTSVDVLIQGSISPDPAHVGKTGDLFIVERIGNSFYMRNTAGIFVPWPSVSIKDLVPAAENIELKASHVVEVFKGKISEAADHRIFLGYMAEGSSGLIYTGSALLLNITANTDPYSLFVNTIFDKIVIGKCTLCHVRGGVADGRASLLFVKDTNLKQANYDIFRTFFDTKDNAYDYVLSKASGGDRHVGGAQLAKGSADYNALQNFLTVLDGRLPAPVDTTSPSAQFFNGVTLQSNLQTLRRAAILLAGRAPTAAEQAAVASGNDATLRTTLQGLMQGSTFHDFLKDAANDRLLVRGNLLPPILPCQNCFPAFSNQLYRHHENTYLTGNLYPSYEFQSQMSYGQEEAPLELIARVVENDLPYSEILTADYTMVNSAIDAVVNSTATFTTDAPHTEFKPGRVTEYYRQDASTVTRQETRFDYMIIVNPGNLRGAYPHVGILNDMAYMARYPSTATNRNRARARWTFFHFLGVDIEQSAQRTTDPTALADTNNPTMNNPNCQVCHAIMDPVAGAFQHYGDDGHYLESWGGMDALDQFYKFPESGSTPYRQGDTWYRDMRAPGFNGVTATGTDTLRWLASQMVADPRFANAAVRFWWPAIMGRELLKRPEVATDGDYAARLLAYDAQEASIATMAAAFTQSGMKVKPLLLDLLMSEWFRAERIDASKVSATQVQAHWIAGLGNEKLLTPEQLARKTLALTGFNWQAKYSVALGQTQPGLMRDYAMYYGGIDSFGVTRRARELTPLMSATALNMALESSCPIVYAEFILPDAQRKLFSGISDTLTPLTEASELKAVDTADATQFKTFSTSVQLGTGPKKAFVSFLNQYCDWDAANSRCRTQRTVNIKSLTLQRPDGTRTVVAGPQLQIETLQCGRVLGSNMYFYSACTASYSFNAEQAGTYQVDAEIAAQQASTELVQIAMGFEADTPPAQSNSSGALQIKRKLVELHQALLGETLDVDSSAIAETFALLADTWQAKRTSSREKHMMNPDTACGWSADNNHLAYVGYPGRTSVLSTTPLSRNMNFPPWDEFQGWYYPRGTDPVHMKKSWQVVVAYLLSHYNYLYE